MPLEDGRNRPERILGGVNVLIAASFSALPYTIRDEWIEDIETLGEKMDEYIDDQKQATGFDLRYNTSLEAIRWPGLWHSESRAMSACG